MPKSSFQYICPRCGYNTVLKKNIRQHFNRKKTCNDKFNIELTEEIIERVYKNGIYHPTPEREKASITNVINNYNTVTNFIGQLDFLEKMTYLLDYQGQKVLDFEDQLENEFEKRVERLENDRYPSGYYLGLSDFFKLVDDITKIDKEHPEKFNLVFDKAIKRFKIYRGKDWESFLEDVGAKELVSLLKSYFLNTYELYLIRNLHADNSKIRCRFKLKEHLEIYYQFISIFDLPPSILDFNDREILGHRLVEHNEHFLAETYMTMYHKIKESVKISERSRVKRKIVNIVKENTVHNLSELNRIIIDLLKIDENFRNEVLSKQMIEGINLIEDDTLAE